MDRRVILDADTKVVTLSNISGLDDLEGVLEDLNEEFDISMAMERINEFAESGELDAASDVLRFSLVNPEEIESLTCEEGEEQRDVSLEEFVLEHETPQSVQDFIESLREGDVVYLRKESGPAHFEIVVESEKENAKIAFGYFDCSGEYDFYDLLDESYLDAVCDSVLPEQVHVEEGAGRVDVFDFEPQVVYGTLYRVITDPQSGIKMLERVEMPAYYFKSELPEEEI